MKYEVVRSDTFAQWLTELRDKPRSGSNWRLRSTHSGRELRRPQVGWGGVSELRVNVGPSYRVYYTVRRKVVVILLCGGDKSSQRQDIRLAQRMANEL